MGDKPKLGYRQPEDAPKPEAKPAPKHWYFFGAGLMLWTTWQISTAVGILLGANIPASWSLDFALPLTFIALVVPALETRAEWAAAAAAGIVAVLAAALPLNLGLIGATLTGMVIGLLFESRETKRWKAKEGAE